jgi:hypothetical protein
MGFFLGAFAITYLISRGFRRFAFKRSDEPMRTLLSCGATLVIFTVIGGYGLAAEVPPHLHDFLVSLYQYGLPVALVGVIDIVQSRKAASAPPTSEG